MICLVVVLHFPTPTKSVRVTNWFVVQVIYLDFSSILNMVSAILLAGGALAATSLDFLLASLGLVADSLRWAGSR